jgi:hypothetical protein
MREPQMKEVDSLRAPRRNHSSRENESRGDGAALGLVIALGLCVLGAIWYVHRHPIDEMAPAAATQGAGTDQAAGGNPMAGRYASESRREMREAPLEKAKPLVLDKFAGPVVHATETDACKSLRLARDRARESLKQRHSDWEAADLKRDLDIIISQGTERGCWSGGTG